MSENYSEDTIKTLEWHEHIRLRPGMYIGKLGDGSSHDDGIYILLKETIDNSIDEFVMGNGKKIEIAMTEHSLEIRDYGRGIPLGKLKDVASKINTGAKYDDSVFKKTVGLNGVGLKAVNALSSKFIIQSTREGKTKKIEFNRGVFVSEEDIITPQEKNGTRVYFEPDTQLFGNFRFIDEYVQTMMRNYVYLNSGLTIKLNEQTFYSERGLFDLLTENMSTEPLYPIVQFRGPDIEVVITHANQYGEEYYSFVNGQHTTMGGTHLQSFKESLSKTIQNFYKKYDALDIRAGIVAAISLKVVEPMFESQTKTKLGSKDMTPGGISVNKFINDFVGTQLDNYLHKNPEVTRILEEKIKNSEKERKDIAGIQKMARERAKRVSLHNKKLRDCRAHLNSNHDKKLESSIFITEGDSASGSITKARDVNTQAVFSLKGKPLNTFSLPKKIIYENEEFNLLLAALNIEEDLESLRYNNVIIATDADVDGMHIRLLLISFFLKFFPDLVKNGHLYILQTPLFRVRSKSDTVYCYSDEERNKALTKLGKTAQITRFKGLGEISPDEFKYFIGKDIRLEPVLLRKQDAVKQLLQFYMGDNTPNRQNFIIENLRVEDDIIDKEEIAIEIE